MWYVTNRRKTLSKSHMVIHNNVIYCRHSDLGTSGHYAATKMGKDSQQKFLLCIYYIEEMQLVFIIKDYRGHSPDGVNKQCARSGGSMVPNSQYSKPAKTTCNALKLSKTPKIHDRVTESSSTVNKRNDHSSLRTALTSTQFTTK